MLKRFFFSLLYFNPDYRDDDESLPTEQGVDALELAKQSEQSLNDLLDLVSILTTT